jgi:O-antigen/teichoic acid export membrane protein
VIKNLKDLAKDTSIYGLSKVISRVAGFFLIPVYTAFFSEVDYGILTLLGTSVVALQLVLTFAMDSAAYKFVGLSKNDSDVRKYAFNANAFVLFLTFVCSTIIVFTTHDIAELLLDNYRLDALIKVSYLACVFSVLSSIPRAVLRIKRKAKLVALSSVVNVFTSISFSLLLIIVFEYGIMGALIGNALGSLSSLIILSWNVKIWDIKTFDFKVQQQMLTYAAPMFPHKAFAFFIPFYAQISLKSNLDFATLGIYALALKFVIPYTTFIGMFQQAWAPYKFEILRNDENPARKFRRLTDVYVLISVVIYVLIATLGQIALEVMATQQFDKASQYIPIVALIPLFQGLYFIFGTGNEFAKSPVWKPVISGISVLLFLSVILFIKPISIWTIAGGVALSFLAMAIGNYTYAQTLFKIEYNWRLILPLVIVIPLALTFMSNFVYTYTFRYLALITIAITAVLIVIARIRLSFGTLNIKEILKE